MSLDQEQIEELKQEFLAIKSKEDLLIILNKTSALLAKDNPDFNPSPIELKTLTYYANPKLCKQRYSSFKIKKKAGDDRTIYAPCPGLKRILRTLNYLLQITFESHDFAMGFVQGKSIVDNAILHVNKNFVYNVDLEDFFYSFDFYKVKFAFEGAPFNFNKEKEPLAFFLACLCTHPLELEKGTKVTLPQGAPTSPFITNILCYRMDRKLRGLAKRFDLVYSRYADDITFSGRFNFSLSKDFTNELERIITKEKLKLKPSKTRMQSSFYRQSVTGIVVNEKVNNYKSYIKDLRMWIFYLERHGLEKTQTIYRQRVQDDKNKGRDILNVISGKLLYMKMVKGQTNPAYIKLVDRMEAFLIGSGTKKEDSKPKPDKFERVVNSLLKDGDIEKAMKLFR
ncbi:reverse transcriptase family protein [Myroides odoratus]|uniref:RNA-directed DNA polymerase n=1 Tax=Myroides odoratus TaxID=256 RepID=A0A378RL51_MYROD|nr:reverse transcriptase family protein [Myroides odoratus]QQU02185.1 RNA-directed DNA polymerase [Myroides odoratus]STZ26907.1 Retron-type reverse transcriptase [Myroides odoratus]